MSLSSASSTRACGEAAAAPRGHDVRGPSASPASSSTSNQKHGAAARRARRHRCGRPSARSAARQIDRPRPVPPNRRVVELSACWKFGTAAPSARRSMPMPVSRDLDAQARAARAARRADARGRPRPAR